MNDPISSHMSGPINTNPLDGLEVSKQDNQTIVTKSIHFKGHEYEITVTINRTNVSESEIKTLMEQTLAKTKMFAKSLGLGEKVSSFTFQQDSLSAKTMDGQDVSSKDLMAKLQSERNRLNDKKEKFASDGLSKKGQITDTNDYLKRLDKLESKIKSLSELTAILGKQSSSEEETEVTITRSPHELKRMMDEEPHQADTPPPPFKKQKIQPPKEQAPTPPPRELKDITTQETAEVAIEPSPLPQKSPEVELPKTSIPKESEKLQSAKEELMGNIQNKQSEINEKNKKLQDFNQKYMDVRRNIDSIEDELSKDESKLTEDVRDELEGNLEAYIEGSLKLLELIQQTKNDIYSKNNEIENLKFQLNSLTKELEKAEKKTQSTKTPPPSISTP
jgi:hypothetical protein